MSRLLAVLRSPWVRAGFLLVAVGAAGYAVWSAWDEIVPALRGLSPGLLLAALAACLVQLLATMAAWRAVLTDLGSSVPLRSGFGIFFVSQLGKYLPGGVWNVVAAGELGADHQVPRRRSLSAMAVTVLISVVAGLLVAAPAIGLADEARAYRWVLVALPVLLLLVLPPVLNRLVALGIRMLGRDPLEHPLTGRGIAWALAWSVAAWVVAGLHVWFIGIAVGLPPTPGTFALAVGGFALAWVAGFLVVVAPAGLGPREAVLLAVLATTLPAPDVLVVVIISRVAGTVADLLLSAAGVAVLRRRTPAPAPEPLEDER